MTVSQVLNGSITSWLPFISCSSRLDYFGAEPVKIWYIVNLISSVFILFTISFGKNVKEDGVKSSFTAGRQLKPETMASIHSSMTQANYISN
ncbi:hypothetical protein AVEN_149560-1 [Araneus ventricosus]|uniref:Uncharacterized protein n=1 Tax=Araneus ventricosus TaxID=182803 RepID=A0A4Y2T9G1_ARAVE|nr:hypothetical protein AVEN_252204-1 [Araneus ventricosus]GBN96152.1 hypothetical protein AVEN_149560-1 [Araneus ventricosus]